MSIQAEIDAAPAGGLVRVPVGTHRVNLRIGKPLTLMGMGEGSVLDGGAHGPVVLVQAPPDAVVKLVGLVVKNGAANHGAGICFESGKRLEVHECAIEENIASAFAGGGIFAAGQELVLSRCRVTGNAARQGGGIHADAQVKARLDSTVIARNQAVLGGGLRATEGAQVELEGCTLAENKVSGKDASGPQLHAGSTLTRATAVALHNCIVGGDATAVVAGGTHPVALKATWCLVPEGTAAIPAHPSLKKGDPLFRASGQAPFALGKGSPAIGIGDPRGVDKESKDLLGRPRVQKDGKVDLGAYAFPR